MRRIRFLVWKELIELRHDPRLFAIVVMAPIIQLLFLGYAATTVVEETCVHRGDDACGFRVWWDDTDHAGHQRLALEQRISVLEQRGILLEIANQWRRKADEAGAAARPARPTCHPDEAQG